MDALYESHVDVCIADMKVNVIPQVVNVKVVVVKVVIVPPNVHGMDFISTNTATLKKINGCNATTIKHTYIT